MAVVYLPDRTPEIQLPDVGGQHYEIDDISIDLNCVKPGEENELFFISPGEFVGFSIGQPTHISRAFNTDIVRPEVVIPGTMGCSAQGAQQYIRVSERQPGELPDGYRVVLLSYDSKRRQEIKEEMAPNASFPTEHNLPAPAEARILLQSILHFMANDYEGGKLVAESLVNLAIVQILKILNNNFYKENRLHSKLRQPAIKHVLEYIEENLDKNIGLSELGDVAALSPFHFLRCFKRSIGKPPHTYLIERRIEKAKILLLNSNKKLCDVAFECGFSSQSHFSAQFKRSTGVTPFNYRKNSQ